MKTENPFKKIERNEKEVPAGLKEKVMDDIASANIILEITGLFLENIPEVIHEMFRATKKQH